MNTNKTDTSNLQSSLDVYRAAACTLNDQLRRVQARINDLEHQVNLILFKVFYMCISNHIFNEIKRRFYFVL